MTTQSKATAQELQATMDKLGGYTSNVEDIIRLKEAEGLMRRAQDLQDDIEDHRRHVRNAATQYLLVNCA